MNEAIAQMLAKYDCQQVADYSQALREIMQEIALLGLWRSKFFEKAAFYGGTALRILHGLDRFSEDLDFSLLQADPGFELKAYSDYLERELAAFGFEVQVEKKQKSTQTAIQSAFLKANTAQQLLVIKTGDEIVRQIPPGQIIRIKLEIDTEPPNGFATESRFLLQPIPFSVRIYKLPDLFAGKMHALLFRRWKNRVKGRDWYDLVWYCSNHPELHLQHLEQRMRQSGHWRREEALRDDDFRRLIAECIEQTDIDQAKQEVIPFVKQPEALAVWSKDFFTAIAETIKTC